MNANEIFLVLNLKQNETVLKWFICFWHEMSDRKGLYDSSMIDFVKERLCTIAAAVIFGLFIPDHEPHGVESVTLQFSSSIFKTLLLPFSRWDIAHFVNIAKFGYVNDYQFVFFPLYPVLLQALAAIQKSFWLETVIISGLVISFIANIVTLNQLGITYGKLSLKPDLIKSALFCFRLNPTLIFFITCYTESLFLCCTLIGTNLVVFDNSGLGLPFICLASCLRSNGSLNSIIFAVTFLQLIIKYYKERKVISFHRCVLLCFAMLASMLPAVIWNIIIYQLLCDYSKEDFPSFCFDSIPNGYAYLQLKYWNVGFMQQYQWRQLPNLCLGFPILFICFKYLYNVVNMRKSWFELVCDVRFPWFVHLLASLIVCTFFAHVQVSTRILCASNPLVYIALGELLQSKHERQRQMVLVYLAVYSVVGMALHVNNFPWT